jgi:ketosteroid isomerase-like protein
MNDKIQVVQQCYAEFGKGNPQGVINLLKDNVVWIDPGYPEIPYAGRRNGKEDVMSFFTGLAETVTLHVFEPREFFCDGANVFVRGYFEGSSNATGKAFQSDFMMQWEVEDGKVKYYQAYLDTAKVANAIKQPEAVAAAAPLK